MRLRAARASKGIDTGGEVNRARRSLLALLVLCAGAAVADTTDSPAVHGGKGVPGLLVGVVSGGYWAKTDELVAARPEHAADLLSDLAWEARGDLIGIDLGYWPRGILRVNGGIWHFVHTHAGRLVNLDYLDSTSAAITHRSVSSADFVGVGWKLSTDFMLVEEGSGETFLRVFARFGYRGNYHVWNARGGEYEYRGRRGRFEDDELLVRYAVRHQVLHGGVFMELEQANGDGFYGRIGGSVSFLPWVEDRDTHVLTDTDYHNTYRLGWYVLPEIAVGVGMGRQVAMEAFYEPTLQYEFTDTRTTIRTPSAVTVPDEKPNYRMALHRAGIRIVWSIRRPLGVSPK